MAEQSIFRHRQVIALTKQIHSDAKKRYSFLTPLFAAGDLCVGKYGNGSYFTNLSNNKEGENRWKMQKGYFQR